MAGEGQRFPGGEHFSERRYAAEFGRYEGTRAAAYPAFELLVGREGERAHFLNLLLAFGRRGAFLITGHRGSGKTTFVNFCLQEYSSNVFRRYLRGNAGRAFFWDRLGHLTVGFLVLSMFLLMTENLQELALLDWHGLLDWLMIVLLGIFCCFPLLRSKELLEVALNRDWSQTKRLPHGKRTLWYSKPELVSILLLCAAGVVLSLWSSLGSAALAVSQLAALAGWIYLVVNLFSFSGRTHADDPGSEDPSYTLAPSRRMGGIRRYWATLALAGMAVLVVLCWPVSPANAEAMVVPFWLLGLSGIALGALRRSLDQVRLHKRLCELRQPPSATDQSQWSAAAAAVAASAFWHAMGSVVILALVGIGLWADRHDLEALPSHGLLAMVLVAGLTTLWLLAIFARRREIRALRSAGPAKVELPFTLHPRPRVLLAFKALFFLAVGLQLAYPLALSITGGRSFKVPGGYEPLSSISLFHRLHSDGQGLFVHRTDEVLWLAGLVLLLAICVFMEYEWVVRPYAMVRDDEAIHWQCLDSTNPPPGPRTSRLQRNVRRHYQRLAEQTFFWKTFTSWLPVLVIPVNLGFDVLEYRVVIEAMLAGLKDRYHQTFLHWSSPLVMLRRWLMGAILVGLAFYAAERWFAAPGNEAERLRSFISSRVGVDVDDMLDWRPLATVDVTNTDLKKLSPQLLIYKLSGLSEDPPRLGSLRVYHLLSLLFFYLAAIALSRVTPVAPYRSTYRRIGRILDSLSSRLKEESKRSTLMRLWSTTFGAERIEGKESGPFDPRTVELAFLQVLADCQNATLHLPFTVSHRVSPPLPEIIFVFDELDKLGDSPGRQAAPAQQPASAAVRDSPAEPQLDRERERTHALRRLFADLKNILSSAPARFIFIGGRNLHDEWLADQSARSPLLSGTFSAEIHISSLLTDPAEGEARLELTGIRSFLHEHWRRARYLHESWQDKNAAPWLWLTVEDRRPVSFIQGEAGSAERSPNEFALELRSCGNGAQWRSSSFFYDAFVDFLGYKSRGNVKKLNSLLESFLRPIGRCVPDPEVRRDLFDCENVLLFHDIDRFRVQLISDVFRQLLPILEERLAYKDDKLGPGVLYLSEFLLKFHRRAFSWSNLGRVDELVHIHHSPDLRAVLEEIVLNWSEKYLHLINNGMYDYRFESEFARELEFLSHHSEQDLAAFNFTLDEAQALKMTYAAQLKVLQQAYASDLLIGLGELHEFDEESETARYYFRLAMRVLDEEFQFQTGAGGDPVLSFNVDARAATGYEAARHVANWGVTRVRLMLQVAMTYEKALDVEHARIVYRDARTLASAIVRALLGWKAGGQRIEGRDWKMRIESLATDLGGYLWTLKNLSILFHPVFAEVWLAEKSVSGPDTSQSLLERELWEWRRELPFVSSGFDEKKNVTDPIGVQHSNFALTLAELHNKAGSLYFFKGRQLVPLEKIKKRTRPDGMFALRGTEGYLFKALTHYSICLHEIRRFNRYRRQSSKVKLNQLENSWETIGSRGWPEFVYRVASGTMSNFADAVIGRVSLVGLLQDLRDPPVPRGSEPVSWPEPDQLFEAIACWLEDSPGQSSWGDLAQSAFPRRGRKQTLEDWFGRPARRQDRGRKLITVSTINSDAERLVYGIIFSLAGGSLLEEAGYLAGASQEYLRVVNTVSQYLWWVSLLAQIESPGQPEEEGTVAAEWRQVLASAKGASRPGLAMLVEGLLGLSCKMLDRFHRLEGRRHRTRRRSPASHEPRWEEFPQPAAITEICSLALGTAALGPKLTCDLSTWLERLGDRLSAWTPWAPSGAKQGDPAWFRLHLMEALDRHSYPLHNRLCGLKVLVDDSLLRPPEQPPPARETETWIEELIELDTLYNSPLHFTPLQSGLTLAMAYLAWPELRRQTDRAGGAGRRKLTEDEVFRAARHKLGVSQQLYTMQRSYYEMISKLYYLYDDFNDRTIHYNQAIQMAGTELASYMIALIEDAQRRRRTTSPTGVPA
jgi:hypothetical protein